jgi:hypothetical protein
VGCEGGHKKIVINNEPQPVSVVLVSFTVNANLIFLEVSDNIVVAVDTVQVTVLGSFTEQLDTLFFDVKFDTGVLNFEESSFYSDLTALVDPDFDSFLVTPRSFGFPVDVLGRSQSVAVPATLGLFAIALLAFVGLSRKAESINLIR